MKRVVIVLFALASISLSAFAQEKKSEIKIKEKSKNVFVVRAKPYKDVVVIINDKKYGSEILDFIDPAKFESIDVLKGDKALEKYGSESVIIMTPKLVAPSEGIAVIERSDSEEDEKLLPLYVIDGEIKSKANLEAISPDEINSVSILKGESATALYGSAAANGVVIIKLKKKKK